MALPDVLTDEQMKKMGGTDLPDTLTDEEMGKLTAPKPSPEDDLRARADAIDRRHASHGLRASDDDLGISSPLAQPKGNLKYLLPPQDLPADYKAEPGLNHEDLRYGPGHDAGGGRRGPGVGVRDRHAIGRRGQNGRSGRCWRRHLVPRTRWPPDAGRREGRRHRRGARCPRRGPPTRAQRARGGRRAAPRRR